MVAEQRLNGVHGGNEPRLIGGLKLFERGPGLPLGPPLQWCERLSAGRRQRNMTLSGVAGGDLPLDQSALFEILQHAAQIAGVEIERADNLDRGRRAALGNLVEQARLAERIGAVEIGLAQHAELPRVEAVEAAHRGDTFMGNAFMAVAGDHGASVGQILD